MAFVIVISGLSGSGKTTLAKRVAEILNGERMCLDDYYRPTDPAALSTTNFEDPSMINAALAAEDIRGWAAGQAVQCPVYDYEKCRPTSTRPLRNAPFIVVEGQYCALYEEVRGVSNLLVFLDPDPGLCMTRRVQRDEEGLGRDREESRQRFLNDVLPTFEEFRQSLADFCHLRLSEGELDSWANRIVQESQAGSAQVFSPRRNSFDGEQYEV